MSFEAAAEAFLDTRCVSGVDADLHYGEQRFTHLGLSRGQILKVVYVERGETIRIISARRATKHEQESYYEDFFDRPRSDAPARHPHRPPCTDEEITAAALTDPDNPPLSREEFARMKRVPKSRSVRRSLGLTQEEFSDAYGIPLGTLPDWEQDRTEPDGAARTYLHVIAAAPDLIRDIIARERARRDAALKALDHLR